MMAIAVYGKKIIEDNEKIIIYMDFQKMIWMVK